VASEKDNAERRNYSRIDFDATVTLKNKQGLWHSILIDISLKGILLNRPGNFEPEIGDLFDVTINLDSDTTIKMRSTLAHAAKESIGLTCNEIGLSSIRHLRQIIELNSLNEDLIHRELDHLINNT